MTVLLKTKTGDEQSVSNGEWAAITAMASAFGIIEKPWNGCHDEVCYKPEQLREIARRARQIGVASDYLEFLADCGDVHIS